MVHTLWSIVNARSAYHGKQKRDITKDVIRSTVDWKLMFLELFVGFLDRWRHSGMPGLTEQTHMAVRQMCLVLVELSKHCLNNLGFNYVLLSRLSSDPIEQRFGWYRLLSGSNYFVSVKQIIESERKIKMVSLLKFDSISYAAITEAFSYAGPLDNNAAKIGKEIFYSLMNGTFVEPQLSDSNIIMYVTGALVRSELRLRNCDQCSSILVNEETQLESCDFSENSNPGLEMQQFINLINRGGLLNPSTVAFAVCLKAWILFNTIKSSEKSIHAFLSSENHLQCFLAIMTEAIENDNDMYQLAMGLTECEFGHPVLRSLVARFFNAMIKNFVVFYSHKDDTLPSDVRRRNCKIRKLSSSTTSRTSFYDGNISILGNSNLENSQ